ncbi:hypothetical protein ACFY1P_18950 [Streptomyces sp. NPDC001407]|uniref:hypothetical protein n=1 Tax=Streptomyces sp. NPDC001407 TaxID=3364573 RepID=UPI0036C78982
MKAVPLTAALALTALAVCAPVSEATPSVRAGRVTLTNADNGHPVTVHTGDDVQVNLTGSHEAGLTYSWSVPVSDAAVLHRTAGSTTPRGDTTARFHAERAGIAVLSAQRHCHADQGHLCPLVIAPWKVRVEVK